MAKNQWLKSWRIKGGNGTPDRRLTLMLSDYDYLLKFETLGTDNKYVEDASILIPNNGDNIQKLTYGFFYKAQQLKSKVYTAADKTPAPVLMDYTMPIFTKDNVEMLRIFSVNREANGKYTRRTFLAYYTFDSYNDFKDIMQKPLENKNTLRSIPESKRKAMIELNTMSITGGTFVYGDVSFIDDISSVLSATEAAKSQVILANHFSKLDQDKSNDDSSSGSYSKSSSKAADIPVDDEFATTADTSSDEDEFPF